MASQYLLLLVFLFINLSLYHHAAVSKPHNNFTDLDSLLAFKAAISDPYGFLTTNWTTNASFCSWIGVYCSPKRQRVVALKLGNFSLGGTIVPHLANLSFLSTLNLSSNTLTGSLPHEIGRLPRLALLNLTLNQLSGPIPSSVFNMSSLVALSLASNNFTGTLPSKDGAILLPRLRLISLSNNQLGGNIPTSFARCVRLQYLYFSYNQFDGTIPTDFGNLTDLKVLRLLSNRLTGKIPTSIGNITSLIEIAMNLNHLQGIIPKELGNLQNLQYLNIGSNSLTGSIPVTLLNASNLSFLQLNYNNLTGSIPATIGESMPRLQILTMHHNLLTGGLDFITSLSNCKDLSFLLTGRNRLEGFLPNSVGNLSVSLQLFEVDENYVSGRIPDSFGNLSSLIILSLSANEFTGPIPSSLARLKLLQYLNLGDNIISGFIPFELGLLTNLGTLGLESNNLSGHIPESLGNFSLLQYLVLDGNILSSNIPNSLWSLTSLLELYLSENSLEGALPSQVANFKSLDKLDLSKNRLSGNISSTLGELQMLTILDLSSNSFNNQIPRSLGGLVNINYLNLSYNSLSGAIPKSLATLRYLNSLDLSFNKLEGQIPEGRVFANISIPFLKENAALCGAIHLGFAPCPSITASSNSKSRLYFLKYVIPPIASIVVLISCFYLLIALRRKSNKAEPPSVTVSFSNLRVISYHELVRATDNFADANLLGKGSVGSVFRACLDDGFLAAVKVLNLEVEGATRSFETECSALGMVRHRNLVKIVSTCSNNNFKALVLQFMPNGSLERWLHSPDHNLNLLQRINVTVDVALALDYLHHQLPHVVVHCDLKPSNILFDENMVAHVGDFGIAKLLFGDSQSALSASIPGTLGYMAPEYGSDGKFSRKSDVYSFGILVLEIFTGKSPGEATFDGGLSLRKWVAENFASVLQIVDDNLSRKDLTSVHQCMSSVLELGLVCSSDKPNERIPMREVVPILQKIKDESLSNMTAKGGRA